MADENQQLTLTIKTVADTSGAQQVSQSLQKVQQQAAQTSQQASGGAQVANQLVRSLVQQHGATQESFQRAVQSVQQSTGIRPTITPASLGITPQTVQAAGRVAEQTERTARATKDIRDNPPFNPSEIARVGAGLFGVGLGLNLAANVAEKLHEAIVGIVTSQLDWERSVAQTRTIWGSLAPQIIATSQAQAQLGVGSQQEVLQANLRASVLTRRYGIPFSDVARLTTGGGLAATALGMTGEQRQQFQEQLSQFALTGAEGNLEQYGFPVRPLDIARRLGLRSEAQLQAFTPGQLAEIRTQLGIQTTAQMQLTGSQDQPGLLARQQDLQRALDTAQGNLQNILEGQTTGRYGVAGRSELAVATNFPLLGPAGERQQQADLAQKDLRDAVNAAQQAVQDLQTDLGNASKQLAESTDKLDKLGVVAGSATASLLGFSGALEDATSFARGDIAAQVQAGVAQRAQPVNPLIAQTPQERFVTASQQADQDAYRQFVARQAQQQLLQNSPIQEFLQQQANQQGPGLEDQRAAARAAIDDRTRRLLGGQAGSTAQQAGQLADRATTEANAQLQRIQITQDERRLAVQDQVVDAKRRELELAGRLSAVQLAQATIQAQATLASGRLQSIQLAESNRRLQYADQQADLQKESIQLQQQMSPLLLEQANLQDRMALASRDNLDIRKQLISAEQAALPSEGALSELNYAQQRIQLQAQVRQAAAIRGQSTAGMPSFAALTQGFVQGELNRPSVELQALDARQQVARAQQASTAEGLGRQMQGAELEAQARAIADQLTPLQAAAREEGARADALQRMLDLLDLQDTKAKTAAESAINLAQQQLIAINQTLVPLQLEAEFAQAASDAIQRSLDLLNLGDAPAQAFWQTMVDGAAQLKLDSEAASRAANDFSAGLVLGVDPAEKIRASLQQGADALLSINNLNNGAGGVGITPYGPSAGGPGSGVNLGGITVNIGAGGNTEAIVDQAVGQFEVQFRQALRASGSAAPPISSSLVGARRG